MDDDGSDLRVAGVGWRDTAREVQPPARRICHGVPSLYPHCGRLHAQQDHEAQDDCDEKDLHAQDERAPQDLHAYEDQLDDDEDGREDYAPFHIAGISFLGSRTPSTGEGLVAQRILCHRLEFTLDLGNATGGDVIPARRDNHIRLHGYPDRVRSASSG